MSLAFLVGEPKFQHVFAQDTLATGETNILLQWRLYVAQRPGVTFCISEYWDVRSLKVYVSALLVYDMVFFNIKLYEKPLYAFFSLLK